MKFVVAAVLKIQKHSSLSFLNGSTIGTMYITISCQPSSKTETFTINASINTIQFVHISYTKSETIINISLGGEREPMEGGK